MRAPEPLRGFDLREGRRPQDLTEGQAELLEQPEGGLLCFACGHPITSERQRFAAGGAHEHTFTNPAGWVYRIGCFRSAPGCAQAGEFTEEYSWFPGQAWRYALCAGCRTHLGWVFRGASAGAGGAAGSAPPEFYGLILDRLVGAEGAEPGMDASAQPGD
jgi:hypothetical protein